MKKRIWIGSLSDPNFAIQTVSTIEFKFRVFERMFRRKQIKNKAFNTILELQLRRWLYKRDMDIFVLDSVSCVCRHRVAN